MQFTTQTKVDKSACKFLDESACYVGKLRARLLQAMLEKKQDINEIKKQYIAEYGLTARQFNSLKSEVQGLVKSATALREKHIEELKSRIVGLKKKLKSLQKKLAETYPACGLNGKKSPRKHIKHLLHQKKRKLIWWEKRLEQTQNQGVRICLGTRKLFQSQYHLEENGYKSHEEWLNDWRAARSNHIFYLGSGDEKFGNQNCQLLGSKLQIRVLPALKHKYGQYYHLAEINFAYGNDVIARAIAKEQAISFRLIRKKKGWYLHLTTDRAASPTTTRRTLGAVGVDLNPSHLAWAETDRYGNLLNCDNIPTPLQDRSSHQAIATLANAIKKVVLYAKKQEKPIVIEELDFAKKKTRLEEKGIPYRRMLSSFAYSLFYCLLLSRAQRAGVEVLETDPAYSSIIGKFKFMLMLGISIHIAAALVLARRGLNFSERLPASYAPRLAEHRHRHVWSLWKSLAKAVSNRELRAGRKLPRLPAPSPPR